MKKKYIFLTIIIILLIISSIFIYLNIKRKKELQRIEEEKNRIIEHTYNLKFEYYQNVYIKDIINIDDNTKIDTTTLGDFNKEIIINKDKYIINYSVVDTTPPKIIGSSTKSIEKGSKKDIKDIFICGDNYDDIPNCVVEGKYDINKIGTYDLTYRATDSSNNTNFKKFKLKVIEPSKSNNRNEKEKVPLKTYVKKYKNDNTMIGMDVSTWQDEINYKKAKEDGIEFVIIRIGFGHTNSGEIKLDNQFKNNIKNAKENGLKVGLYLYSYAENIEEAKEQANWIIKNLDGEKLDLPIAFDWENWSSFNSYKMSFTKLNNTAQAFIDVLEEKGYTGMLYSSAYYLNRIWGEFKNNWLAYYTDNNDFNEKPFIMWQLTSNGKVNGVSGPVDIDILYKDKMSN